MVVAAGNQEDAAKAEQDVKKKEKKVSENNDAENKEEDAEDAEMVVAAGNQEDAAKAEQDVKKKEKKVSENNDAENKEEDAEDAEKKKKENVILTVDNDLLVMNTGNKNTSSKKTTPSATATSASEKSKKKKKTKKKKKEDTEKKDGNQEDAEKKKKQVDTDKKDAENMVAAGNQDAEKMVAAGNQEDAGKKKKATGNKNTFSPSPSSAENNDGENKDAANLENEPEDPIAEQSSDDDISTAENNDSENKDAANLENEPEDPIAEQSSDDDISTSGGKNTLSQSPSSSLCGNEKGNEQKKPPAYRHRSKQLGTNPRTIEGTTEESIVGDPCNDPGLSSKIYALLQELPQSNFLIGDAASETFKPITCMYVYGPMAFGVHPSIKSEEQERLYLNFRAEIGTLPALPEFDVRNLEKIMQTVFQPPICGYMKCPSDCPRLFPSLQLMLAHMDALHYSEEDDYWYCPSEVVIQTVNECPMHVMNYRSVQILSLVKISQPMEILDPFSHTMHFESGGKRPSIWDTKGEAAMEKRQLLNALFDTTPSGLAAPHMAFWRYVAKKVDWLQHQKNRPKKLPDLLEFPFLIPVDQWPQEAHGFIQLFTKRKPKDQRLQPCFNPRPRRYAKRPPT
jgi:hypothetical protein